MSAPVLLRRALAAAALAGVALLPTGRAAAHLGDISYIEIAAGESSVDLKIEFAAHLVPGGREGVRLSRAQALAMEPTILDWLGSTITVSGRSAACVPSIVNTIGPNPEDDLTVLMRYACNESTDSLRVDFHAFDDTLPAFQSIAKITHRGENLSYVFTAESPILKLGTFEQPGTGETAWGFFRFGVEHIWGGYDHLLFLIALLLPGGSLGKLVAMVTAFTVAHSLTLAAAVLGWVTLDPGLVEITIAASVVYVAARSLASSAPDVAHRDERTAVTFLFGLIHGFGFAGVLAEAGLEAGNVLVPLLSFNAGVEVGQLAVVIVAVALLRALQARPGYRTIRRAAAWCIICIGLFWMGARIGDRLG